MTQTTSKRDVYQIVTDRIIELLGKGTVPWQQPWTKAGIPQNLISKKAYRGINVWLLASLNYPKNLFLSSKQLGEIGGQIKEGERPNLVVFWKWLDSEKEQETGAIKDKKKIPLLRYHMVYNVTQCENIPKELLPSPEKKFSPIKRCQETISSMPMLPVIQHKENEAYYDVKGDLINLPPLDSFKTAEGYYGTLFHELVHSTGHATRLNRKEVVQEIRFGSMNYSIEELTAEIGACYLRSYSGIGNKDLVNSASYIDGWLQKLKSDRRFIVYACTQAQKASDYILNIPKEEYEIVSQEKQEPVG